jgi:teichuronic acid biosynthesis glycosyltransferase TuaG
MPAYNSEKYIHYSIESVLLQTYQNWELIIINDGSTDLTQNIVDEYIQIDKRIVSYYQKNGKQGKARNLGISESKGDFLAFLDSDDLWLPDKLEVQINELLESKADLVFSRAYVIDSENNKSNYVICGHLGYLFGYEGVELMIKMNKVPILTVFVKKDIIISSGGFIEDYLIANAEDYHLWLKLLMNKYVFWGSNRILASYRDYENSATAMDKLSTDKLPFVYKSLLNNFNGYNNILLRRIKLIFSEKYRTKLFSKTEIKTELKFNCFLLDKFYLYPLFWIMVIVFPISWSKYILRKYLNA